MRIIAITMALVALLATPLKATHETCYPKQTEVAVSINGHIVYCYGDPSLYVCPSR